jgi:hypothetical protein
MPAAAAPTSRRRAVTNLQLRALTKSSLFVLVVASWAGLTILCFFRAVPRVLRLLLRTAGGQRGLLLCEL